MDIWIITLYWCDETKVVGASNNEALATEIAKAALLNTPVSYAKDDEPCYGEGYWIDKVKLATV